MVYTQMLFALAGDKLVFGVSPDVWSWVGSGLILAGAIWVAAAKEDSAGVSGGVAVSRRRRNSAAAADAAGMGGMHLSNLVNGKGAIQQHAVREEEVGLMSGAGDDDDPGEGVELAETGQDKNNDR